MTTKTPPGRCVTETVAVALLKPAVYNPRTISDEALAGLGQSVERFGLVQPIVWNRRSGNVVGGHQRLRALLAQGVTEIDCVVVDLDDAEEKALNLALNSESIQGSWTPSALGLIDEILASLPSASAALLLPDLRDRIDALLPFDRKPVNEDELLAPPTNPVTRLGDVIRLGEHRILCGDATNADDVAHLLGGVVPGLMVTDPPYGVNYDPAWRKRALNPNLAWRKTLTSVGCVDNDERPDWTPAWRLFPGSVAYVWHGGLHTVVAASAIESAGFELRAQIIWRKQHAPISRGAYHWQHEPCWYAVRKGATAHWAADRKETTVWDIEGMSPVGDHRKADDQIDKKTGHGTQKPVECMARPIRNHEAEVVYDPFLGSGSTLIAAEVLGRKCFGLDLDPAYCDVAVARWERVTGRHAERIAAS